MAAYAWATGLGWKAGFLIPLAFSLVVLVISGFCIYAINSIVFTYAAYIDGRVFSETYSGVLNFSAYLGAAVQSVVYGFALDNGGWGIVFVSIAVFNILIAVLGVIGSRKK